MESGVDGIDFIRNNVHNNKQILQMVKKNVNNFKHMMIKKNRKENFKLRNKDNSETKKIIEKFSKWPFSNNFLENQFNKNKRALFLRKNESVANILPYNRHVLSDKKESMFTSMKRIQPIENKHSSLFCSTNMFMKKKQTNVIKNRDLIKQSKSKLKFWTPKVSRLNPFFQLRSISDNIKTIDKEKNLSIARLNKI